MQYTGLSGRVYTLSGSLGAGGEGTVYDILNDNKHVCKVYKPEHFKSIAERNTTERKLKAMLSMKLSGYSGDTLLFTWPQDIIYSNGIMTGYIMPRVNSRLKIYSVYRMGDDVRRIYPNFTWKYSVQFAYNLAGVVDYLHSNGIVVGDFNQNNIYIDTHTSAVVLIDCDSFDITDPHTGEHFPCTVGFSEVLAPELQTVGNLKNGKFTKDSDNFSLAIHIFRLLMRNADPFGGLIESGASTSNVPANRAIINGECQYVRDVGKKIPSWSPKLDAMPPEIQELFNKTFNYTAINALQKKSKRATAGEWCKALYPYARPEPNKLLKTCPNNKLHVYAVHNKKCPWCLCEGIDFDPYKERLNKIFSFLTKAMRWATILSIAGCLLFTFVLLHGGQASMACFRGNISAVLTGLSANHSFYLSELFTDKFVLLRVNLNALFRQYAVNLKASYFFSNNRYAVQHFGECLQNLSSALPVLTSLFIRNLQMAGSIISSDVSIFEKIRELVSTGGK